MFAEHLESHAVVNDVRETCWRCEPGRTRRTSDYFLVLVEDRSQRCPWCDGTGQHNYEFSARGYLYRPCGQCGGTGQRK